MKIKTCSPEELLEFAPTRYRPFKEKRLAKLRYFFEPKNIDSLGYIEVISFIQEPINEKNVIYHGNHRTFLSIEYGISFPVRFIEQGDYVYSAYFEENINFLKASNFISPFRIAAKKSGYISFKDFFNIEEYICSQKK